MKLADPGDTPVATPLLMTVATGVLLLLQPLATLYCVPEEYVPMNWYCCVCCTAKTALPGTIEKLVYPSQYTQVVPQVALRTL